MKNIFLRLSNPSIYLTLVSNQPTVFDLITVQCENTVLHTFDILAVLMLALLLSWPAVRPPFVEKLADLHIDF